MDTRQQEDLRKRGQQLLLTFDAAGRKALRRSAGFARLREAALRTEHAMAAHRHGAEAPEARAALRRLTFHQRLATEALATASTAAAGEQIASGDAAVLGQVRAPSGRPMAGLFVILTDERKKPSKGSKSSYLARTETDSAGFFLLKAPEKEFARFFARSKQLVLKVEGGRFEVNHVLVLPIGDRKRRLWRIDIELPPEALNAPLQPAPPTQGPTGTEGPAFAGGEGWASPAETAPAAVDVAAEAAEGEGKVLLAQGAVGELVRQVQLQLREAGFSPGKADSDFGPKTRRALTAFQRHRGLEDSGEMTVAVWRELMATDPPPVDQCSLQLTAAFEGHGFGLAQGNWDDAGITWGIIGFTLRHGEIGKIVRAIHQSHPEILVEDFGPTRSRTLLEILDKPLDEQIAWADSISLVSNKARLHKPWREAFARFGERSEVQALQMERVEKAYLAPARRTAEELGLTSELGLALCFDAHVQNGGVKAAARRQIEEQKAANPPADEKTLREIVANAVADKARARFREDVRSRKLTLATGEGEVHGRFYELRSWGLGERRV